MRIGGRHVHYHMDVGFISTYALSACHCLSCEFQSHWGQVYNLILYHQVSQLVAGQ